METTKIWECPHCKGNHENYTTLHQNPDLRCSVYRKIQCVKCGKLSKQYFTYTHTVTVNKF